MSHAGGMPVGGIWLARDVAAPGALGANDSSVPASRLLFQHTGQWNFVAPGRADGNVGRWAICVLQHVAGKNVSRLIELRATHPQMGMVGRVGGAHSRYWTGASVVRFVPR